MGDPIGVEGRGADRHWPEGYPALDNSHIILVARLKKPTQGVGILLGCVPDNNRRRNNGIPFRRVFA